MSTSDDAMYRHLVAGVKDYAIYLMDENGVVLNWNEGAQRSKGYRAGEIVGRNFDTFYTPADQKLGLSARNLKHARANGHFADEGWRVRKDGSQFWAHVRSVRKGTAPVKSSVATSTPSTHRPIKSWACRRAT